MGESQFRYDQHKEKIARFEADESERLSNPKKYKYIHAIPANCSYCYKLKGKQLASKKTLADIYEFKLKYEAENER